MLIFGYVDLATYADSEKFKYLMKDCLQDYLNSEMRIFDGIYQKKIVGRVDKVYLPGREEVDEMKFGLSGDIYNFQLYLMTMVFSYYRGKLLKIQFHELPLIKTFRKRPARVGEIIVLDYETVYTGYDDDPILNFLVNSGGGSRDGSDTSGDTSDVKTTLLPKFKRNSKEKVKVKEICCSDCCKIS